MASKSGSLGGETRVNEESLRTADHRLCLLATDDGRYGTKREIAGNVFRASNVGGVDNKGVGKWEVKVGIGFAHN